jgi:ribosomal protein S18 acetylase RimI-like enzyme
MQIVKAERRDLPVILELQRIAYQSEAALLGTDDIPPLKQTLKEVSGEFEECLILKGVLDGVIIGSIRALSDGQTCYVGKLIVSPDHQRKGFGSRLLAEIETTWPHERYELFTSDKSTGNIRLYERMGYTVFRDRQIRPGLRFVYLEKIRTYRR